MINKQDIKKILIIRYRFIGDTVLTIPFVKNVKENFPDVQIDVLVSPNSGELLENNPDVNNVIYFDNSRFHKYERRDVINHVSTTIYNTFFSCAIALQKEKYDLVFVLKRSFSSALLAFLSGAKYRIGFNTELRSFLLTHSIPYKKETHELDNFLNCLKPLGIEPKRYIPEIFPTGTEEAKASGFLVRLDRFKPKVLIHASSAHPYKQWPKRYFAEVMDTLFEKYEAQFIFTGAKIDQEIYEKILGYSKNKKKFKFLNLCGLLTLRECFALYRGLNLALCVDSGNAHLSAAAEIPTYVLYGPTNPVKWLPIGKNVFPVRLKQLLPCQPCDVKVFCSHLSCMKVLTPGIILDRFNHRENEALRQTCIKSSSES